MPMLAQPFEWRLSTPRHATAPDRIDLRPCCGLTTTWAGTHSLWAPGPNRPSRHRAVADCRSILSCRELGVAIHGTLIMGLPGETQETIRETIAFAKEVNPHTLQVSLAAPYPGTHLYKQALENGWLDDANAELVDENGVQMAPLHYPGLSHTEIFDSVETFYRSFGQDRLDRRPDGHEPRHDEAAPARGRGVLPLPARAAGGRALNWPSQIQIEPNRAKPRLNGAKKIKEKAFDFL